MLTAVLIVSLVYFTVGIIVTSTLNFIYVDPAYRLNSIRESIPVVVGWPLVLYVFWAFTRG
ncbi:hypothetical protein [Mesobacillus zeae]|uniref:Uncharacterized protein n=1 Tax=Mesobacillus zeae TaxID=1917180 RepID=A0A398BH75_9BACI|nr:hypothetical protein [Mesobacillus zeae]RID88954.1 hypothetical protein D1970_00185 [Mesobacillus zeae]